MRDDAVNIFYEGLQAVEPGAAVKNYCRLDDDQLIIGDWIYDLREYNNLYVIGAGKAAAPMAATLERILGKRITSGIVNVKYKHLADLKRVKLIEAGHPCLIITANAVPVKF